MNYIDVVGNFLFKLLIKMIIIVILRIVLQLVSLITSIYAQCKKGFGMLEFVYIFSIKMLANLSYKSNQLA